MKKIRKNLIFRKDFFLGLLLLLLIVSFQNGTLVGADLEKSSNSELGLNVENISDWSSPFFSNLMKQARPWGLPGSPCWGDAGPSVDANGWPNADAGVCLITTGQPGSSRIPVGTYSLSFKGQATVSAHGDCKNFVRLQNLTYNSSTNTTTGEIVVTEGARQLHLSFTNTKRKPTDSQATGITAVSVLKPGYKSTPVFDRLLISAIKSSKAKTVRLMSALETNNTQEIQWQDRTLPGHANQFLSIPKKDPLKYDFNKISGIAFEHTIALANETGNDIWINIPDQATDDYVYKLALLYKYGSDKHGNPYTSPQKSPVWAPLNSKSRLYVEYSNELWNSDFQQFSRQFNRANASDWSPNQAYSEKQYVKSNGNLYQCIKAIARSSSAPTSTALNINDGVGSWTYVSKFPTYLAYDGETNKYYLSWRLTADRILQISNIFRTVFGDAAIGDVIRPVLATQIANGGVFSQQLRYLDSVYGPENSFMNPKHSLNYYLTGLAGAPYFKVPSLHSSGPNNPPWPSKCKDSMSTCTSYSPFISYPAGSYMTADGKLYKSNSNISGQWQPGQKYWKNSKVINGGNLYQASQEVSNSITAPTGSAQNIMDANGGSWTYISSASNRTMPSGFSNNANYNDGEGSWSFVYSYGNKAEAITQAFNDINNQFVAWSTGTSSLYNFFVTQALMYGLAPLAYESGLDVSLAPFFNDIFNSSDFQNDPRMVEIEKESYNSWYKSGGKLMNHFTLSSPYEFSSFWGLTDDLVKLDTGRMRGYIQMSSQSSMPQVTAGKLIPATLNPSEGILLGGYSGYTTPGTQKYNITCNCNMAYEISIPADGSYRLTTNIYYNDINLKLGTGNIGRMAVGNQSITVQLKAGLNVLVISPSPITSTVPSTFKSSWDPIIIEKI